MHTQNIFNAQREIFQSQRDVRNKKTQQTAKQRSPLSSLVDCDHVFYVSSFYAKKKSLIEKKISKMQKNCWVCAAGDGMRAAKQHNKKLCCICANISSCKASAILMLEIVCWLQLALRAHKKKQQKQQGNARRKVKILKQYFFLNWSNVSALSAREKLILKARRWRKRESWHDLASNGDLAYAVCVEKHVNQVEWHRRISWFHESKFHRFLIFFSSNSLECRRLIFSPQFIDTPERKFSWWNIFFFVDHSSEEILDEKIKTHQLNLI